ncbi:CPBP family intramembrane metalloprotease [Paenibacillus spiritus]|uniref:CPBP family intramembrane metalloprotease n=1 Tax=Paenibacillus spiritus TaxID=2496557 RepID=A0A5J5GK66_9BACL|nr:CPBP family intramembrane glutamic endopeptidase [Paenibacillus spiritus]KAA9008595.1 CPBP family intramembrane metalloprotease [Paenibacillus spiritus]
MNSVGQPLQQRPINRRLLTAAIVGLLIFIGFNWVPSWYQSVSDEPSGAVISRDTAAERASAFAEARLGYTPAPGDTWSVLYESDSKFYGYLSRKNLTERYMDRNLDEKYPYDYYRATLIPSGADDESVAVFLNMYTGDVVGFNHTLQRTDSEAANRQTLASKSDTLSEPQMRELAEPWLKLWGANLDNLTYSAGSDLVVTDKSVAVGEASLQYRFGFEREQVNALTTRFTVPQWHTDYMDSQKRTATLLTMVGYGLPTLILGILALIYSILRRHHTSFKRGLFLSLFYFAVMMSTTYNVYASPEQALNDSRVTNIILFVVYTLYSLLMSVLLYFSLVGGDGLWRKEGVNAWPRAREQGYGRYVLDSVYTGYLWAFVLLGVQTLIFIVLQNVLGSWYTTDASQSTYNMKYAWLLPLTAWLAGLSEEALYRFFGIRMLSKVVRSTVLASLITTLVWAFGHTLYPIYPVSSRPIELTVIGLLFSFIFLRYGFIAVMFSHVIFDSILMGSSLIFMKDAVNIGSGIVSMILPLIVGYLVYRFNPPGRERTVRLWDSPAPELGPIGGAPAGENGGRGEGPDTIR